MRCLVWVQKNNPRTSSDGKENGEDNKIKQSLHTKESDEKKNSGATSLTRSMPNFNEFPHPSTKSGSDQVRTSLVKVIIIIRLIRTRVTLSCCFLHQPTKLQETWSQSTSWVKVLTNDRTCFCRTLWCPNEVDLWPFGYTLSSLHFHLMDIWVKFCHATRMRQTNWKHTASGPDCHRRGDIITVSMGGCSHRS